MCMDPVNQAGKPQSLKILFIGNSYSDDTIQWAWQIATSAGLENVIVANLYRGGCTIEEHLSFLNRDSSPYVFRHSDSQGQIISSADGEEGNHKIDDGLFYADWDWIIFQQGSRDSGLAERYAHLPLLVDYVKQRATNPHVRYAFNMTWAYAQKSLNPWFENYGRDQNTMYQGILNAVKTRVLSNKDIELIIPNGTAVQNARTSYLGDHLTRDDCDHLTYGLGRYIVGLTCICALTGLNPTDISFAPEGLSEREIRVAKESAKNALANPFEVTNSIDLK